MQQLLSTRVPMSAVGLILAFACGSAMAQGNQAPATPGATAGSPDANKPGGIQATQSATVALRFVSVQPADTLSSRLIGSNVYNRQNESIGEIEDFVIENGKTIKAVIISVGGFLGLGERYVAVDPSTLIMHREGDNNMRVMANTTKDELKNAPSFNYSKKR